MCVYEQTYTRVLCVYAWGYGIFSVPKSARKRNCFSDLWNFFSSTLPKRKDIFFIFLTLKYFLYTALQLLKDKNTVKPYQEAGVSDWKMEAVLYIYIYKFLNVKYIIITITLLLTQAMKAIDRKFWTWVSPFFSIIRTKLGFWVQICSTDELKEGWNLSLRLSVCSFHGLCELQHCLIVEIIVYIYMCVCM